jgi:hypothetical protein
MHYMHPFMQVGACISHLGDAAELAAALPSLVELDLTCNLVSGWDVAEGLCCAMTHLQVRVCLEAV